MYQAVICHIRNVRPHPNADRLKLASAQGNQVVVGLDTREGDLGIFFGADGQLSTQFAQANDLIRRKDETGKAAGGMFDNNRRVRIQKFRGEKSEGFWIPIESLQFAGSTSEVSAGLLLTEFNGVPICSKYETAATKLAKKQGKQGRGSTPMFARHFDTEQFRNIADNIPDGAIIHISEKLHGTSHRVGRVLEPVKQNFLERLFKRPAKFEWKILHGSRNVILDDGMTDSFYHTNFRGIATQRLAENLRKGEVIYLEIVGYSDSNTPIMPRHNSKKLGDKDFTRLYGETITYDYGLEPGETEIYIYRITNVNEDGQAVDLSYNQMRARAMELGVNPVPHYMTFTMVDVESLKTVCEHVSDGPSWLDAQQPREGICIRVEHPDMFATAKLKSFNFLALEQSSKDDDDVVDIEEVG